MIDKKGKKNDKINPIDTAVSRKNNLELRYNEPIYCLKKCFTLSRDFDLLDHLTNDFIRADALHFFLGRKHDPVPQHRM